MLVRTTTNSNKDGKKKKIISWFKHSKFNLKSKNKSLNAKDNHPNFCLNQTNFAQDPRIITHPYPSDIEDEYLPNYVPKLKPWSSTPTKLNNLNLTIREKNTPSNTDDADISHSELKSSNQLWLALNEDKCDPMSMKHDSSNKHCKHTLGGCRCSKRLKFVVKHCSKFILEDIEDNIDGTGVWYNDISSFMSSLNGYSTVQLSRDFKHLQRYHYDDKYLKDYKPQPGDDLGVLVKEIYSYITKNKPKPKPKPINKEAEDDVYNNEEKKKNNNNNGNDKLIAVSKLMIELGNIKEFNLKHIKLRELNRGANGTIYAVKSWKNRKFYAMKEISFQHLSIDILYEILRNWKMAQDLSLVNGDPIELYVDTKKSLFLIVQHLFKGSMCDLLKTTYLNKKRCLSELEIKDVLNNGVLPSLEKLHSNNYIHGDIKPENIVYQYNVNQNKLQINTAIIDYDLCTLHDGTNNISMSWRGTLGYSPPEWIPYKRIKSTISDKVDIFSLGLTILILLRGEQPFLCPTSYKIRLKKQNPNMDIKKLLFQTMINDGEFMVDNFLNSLLDQKLISDDLFDLLGNMLKFNPTNRYNVYQVINHKWFQ